MHETEFSINTKETLAVWYALQAFSTNLQGHHVLIRSDNMTVLSTVQKMGCMTSKLRDDMARDIWT